MTHNTQAGQDALKADYIDREEARRVVHAAIFGQCMKDKNTCAGDYSYHALAAVNAIPPLPAPTAGRLALEAAIQRAQFLHSEICRFGYGKLREYAQEHVVQLAALIAEKPDAD